MLFDLRSRGRRRTVQAVYLGLAVLMGGGLVLFGVGAGNGFGGILNAFTGGGSSGAQTQVVSQAEKNALAQTKLHPSDPAGWAALVQAKTYYMFEIFTMIGIGLAFQLPLGLLALQQLGVINSRTLTGNWRYATVIIAVVAAAMPGADPVTTGLETAPLVILFLVSIVLLKVADRRAARRAAAEERENPTVGVT